MVANESPANKIINHLQRHGEATVKDLEEALGVSTTAVREQLAHLQARDLLETRLVRQGPGRPRLVYFLTPAAQHLVPKAYDTLITMLLREVAGRAGPEQVQALLDGVAARLADMYRGQVTGDDIAQRLSQLAAALEARGIPAAAQPAEGSIELFACPYLDVAHEHAAVCTMEQQMLEQLLGETILVNGTIREGRRSCQFRVKQSDSVSRGNH